MYVKMPPAHAFNATTDTLEEKAAVTEKVLLNFRGEAVQLSKADKFSQW